MSRQMMAIDLMNMGSATNFGTKLFELIAKADFVNRETLRIAYPEQVAFWEEWQARTNGPTWLAALAQGEEE